MIHATYICTYLFHGTDAKRERARACSSKWADERQDLISREAFICVKYVALLS